MKDRRLSWILVGVAIFIVLGHVCATPLHAHAGAVTTHTEDRPEHDGGDVAHGGSCEALRASSNIDVPVLPPTDIVPPVIRNPEIQRAHAAPTSAPVSSPPLFLLHAALLI